MPDWATWLIAITGVLVPLCGAFGWMIKRLDELQTETSRALEEAMNAQNSYRHENTNRISLVINSVEERLTRRIERLENDWRLPPQR